MYVIKEMAKYQANKKKLQTKAIIFYFQINKIDSVLLLLFNKN